MKKKKSLRNLGSNLKKLKAILIVSLLILSINFCTSSQVRQVQIESPHIKVQGFQKPSQIPELQVQIVTITPKTIFKKKDYFIVGFDYDDYISFNEWLIDVLTYLRQARNTMDSQASAIKLFNSDQVDQKK